LLTWRNSELVKKRISKSLLREKREEGRREMNTINRGHYVLPATPNGSARTLLRPIFDKKLLLFNKVA
jgi:hypothetical protein